MGLPLMAIWLTRLTVAVIMNIVPLGRNISPLRPATSLPRSFSLKSGAKLRSVPPKFDPKRASAQPPSFADLVIKPSLSQFPKIDLAIVNVFRSRAVSCRRGITERKRDAPSPLPLKELKGARFPLQQRRKLRFRLPTEKRSARKEHVENNDEEAESPQMSRWVGSTHDSPLVIKRL